MKKILVCMLLLLCDQSVYAQSHDISIGCENPFDFERYCRVEFTYYNTGDQPNSPRVRAIIYDQRLNTLQDTTIRFGQTLPRKFNSQRTSVSGARCEDIRQVDIDGHVVPYKFGK